MSNSLKYSGVTIKQEPGDRTLLCTLQLIRNTSVFLDIRWGLMTQVKCYFEVLLMHEQEKKISLMIRVDTY